MYADGDADAGELQDQLGSPGQLGEAAEANDEAEAERLEQVRNLLNGEVEPVDIGTIIQDALDAKGLTSAKANPTVVQLLQPMDPANWSQYPMTPEELFAMARPVAVRLGTKLETVLEAKTEELLSHRRSGRKLDARRVTGLRLGDVTIFQGREDAEGLNTAVALVGDLSGSMYDRVSLERQRHIVAKTALLAVGDVLERHDVPFSLTVYGSYVSEVMPFDGNWRRQRRFVNLENLGGTSTAEVLRDVAEKIAVRREDRRLVVLVTDGDAHDPEMVMGVMNEMTEIGVEFANVFIGTDGVTQEKYMRDAEYPVHRVVDPANLPQVIFESVRNAF